MNSLALGRRDVVVGVDTHKHGHVAVPLDGLGGRLGEITTTAAIDGHRQLLDWACSLGRVHALGVEGTALLRRRAGQFPAPSRRPGDRGQPPATCWSAASVGQERHDRC